MPNNLVGVEMSFQKTVAAIVFALYAIASTPSMTQENNKRPYTSRDENIDRILELYHEQQPNILGPDP